MKMSLESTKKELKDWEKSFNEIFGRKPAKRDVDAAPAKIKKLYQEYARLRNSGSSDEQTGNAIAGKKYCLNRKHVDFSKPFRPLLSKMVSQKSKPIASQKAANSSNDLPSTDIIHPLGGINPVFSDEIPQENTSPIGQNHFISYYRSLSPQEMAIKRKNLFNLAQIDIDADHIEDSVDPWNQLDSESIENVDLENEQMEDDNETAGEPGDQKPLMKKRSKSKRSNDNFLALNMKRGRYQCKGLKKLKGAALKRFLFKQRMRRQKK